MLRLSKPNIAIISVLALSFLMGSCSPEKKDYAITVYQTSQSGDNLKLILADPNTQAASGSKKVSLTILSDQKSQEYIGFGASFTESSAWNLATIPDALRKEVMTRLFSPTEGAGFSLTRTHINSSDYSNNHYTYVESGDTSLATFSINEDLKGFTGEENDQVRGIELIKPDYDLIPMILEAQSVKGADFKIIASPWESPILDEIRRNFRNDEWFYSASILWSLGKIYFKICNCLCGTGN